MRNMAFKLFGNVLIAYYNDRAPTDEDHAASMAAIRTITSREVRFLTFTRGGAPSAPQRKDMNDFLANLQLRTAVVSDALMVRGSVTALSWFNRNVRVFKMDEAEDAFAYLGIEPPMYDRVWEEVRRLEAELERYRKESLPARTASR